MNAVRDRASVSVSQTVSGAKRRKPRSPEKGRNSKVESRQVPDIIMDAARAARRTGERIVVVSETEVMLVPERR